MGLVHIYCGDGKGKTTSATGLAVRAIGSGRKVLFVQFFKNGNSCEIKVLKTLENLTYMKSEKNFGRFVNMSDEEKIIAKDCFNSLLEKAMSLSKDFDMIVFDEIISCYNHGFFDKEKLHQFLSKKEENPEIVLTGRNPSEELIEIADYVSEIKKIKHPFDQGIKARYGIEF